MGQARGHTAQTLNSWPGSQVHTHIRVVTRPRAARLGPGPRLVAMTVAAAEAATVMAWERGRA